jgi:TonB family protein
VQVGPSRGPSLAEGNAPAAYPLSARRRGEEGTTVVRARVDATGSVAHAEVARSSGVEAIDEAAVAAVRSWRFLPALDKGNPVASDVELPVVFRLRLPSPDRRSAPRGGQLHGGANPSPTAPRILVDPRHLHETPPKGNGRWRLVRF